MVPKNVGELLEEHVSLELQSIDRLYLNAFQPRLQTPRAAAYFIREVLGNPYPSTAALAGMTRSFVSSIERFAKQEGVEIISFTKAQRKDEVAAQFIRRFEGREGVLFIGKAQEKVKTFRTVKLDSKTGGKRPWIVPGTAMPNQYYFYIVDEDFGPMFVKLSSYFPYTGRLCVNGHEWLKRQLAKEGIAFEPLDNGVLACDDPVRMQQLADELDAAKIDAVFRKWLGRLPHPFDADQRRAGYLYELSILQAEFALTQVFDRPLSGRQFFEAILHEHLDLGRPSNVQLIFGRRVTRRTPGSFRTRILTQGIIPALNIYYKHSRIKQYFKEQRALRTETTINNTKDFYIGRRLCNLPALREVGFSANRRLLNVQHLSHDPIPGDDLLRRLNQPLQVGEQRASALRLCDDRTMDLMAALCVFVSLPGGFRNRDMRAHVAQLLRCDPATITPGRMTYDLRRLRLHGLIQRVPGTFRYHLTESGARAATVYSRLAARVLRPALAGSTPTVHRPGPGAPINRALLTIDRGLDCLLEESRLAVQT
jgi:hypothetical protein